MRTGGFERILFATDGSEQADAAAEVAASLALGSQSKVRVVHVWNLEVHHRHGMWDVETRMEAERLIREAVCRFRTAGVDADGQLARADADHAGAAIAEVARQFDAELVVVGSRGLSDWQAMRRHSVSHSLLSALDCQLLVVRAAPRSVHDPRRILVAVAGGEDVPRAVRAAIAAGGPGAKVLVLHVEQAVIGAQGFAYYEPQDEIQETVRQARDMLVASGAEATIRVAEPGHIAAAVADAAAGWDADVIVLGSSRTGDISSMLFGSVTHDLLRRTDRPVLVAEKARL
jgi:nucleotide-binding universal stress UspA family protein